MVKKLDEVVAEEIVAHGFAGGFSVGIGVSLEGIEGCSEIRRDGASRRGGLADSGEELVHCGVKIFQQLDLDTFRGSKVGKALDLGSMSCNVSQCLGERLSEGIDIGGFINL